MLHHFTSPRHDRTKLSNSPLEACHCGLSDVVVRLVNDEPKTEDLETKLSAGPVLSAEKGHFGVVNRILPHVPQSSIANAVRQAARFGHNATVDALLNQSVSDIETANDQGCNALLETSRGGYLEVVSSLLEKGADVGSTNNDKVSALHLVRRRSTSPYRWNAYR